MRAGGGVGFARLLHASANEALAILLGWHCWVPLGVPPTGIPQQRRRAAPKVHYVMRSGSMPPFASRGPSLGEGRRGWARIYRPCRKGRTGQVSIASGEILHSVLRFPCRLATIGM